MKYIYVTGSNVAKYTGHNKYEPLDKVVNELLSKNGIKDVYIPKSNIEEGLLQLQPSQLLRLCEELDIPDSTSKSDIEKKIKSTILLPSQLSTITEEESKILVDLKTDNKEVLQSLLSNMKQDLRMRRGNIKEDINLNKIQKKENIQIDQRNSKMYTKELYRCDKYVIILRGKVDGQSGDKIIESKNRTRCLFNELRDYEKVQLECYMYLTGLKKALLTEHYNQTENCIEYIHDDIFWNECLTNIVTFMNTHIAPSILIKS
jgi:hypothetical protein